MSKVLDSPVDKWEGKIYLPDYLTLPQTILWESALRDYRKAITDRTNGSGDDSTGGAAQDEIIVRGIVAIVEKFEIEGLPEYPTVETFPGSPRRSSARLIAYLTGEIQKIYAEEIDVPK